MCGSRWLGIKRLSVVLNHVTGLINFCCFPFCCRQASLALVTSSHNFSSKHHRLENGAGDTWETSVCVFREFCEKKFITSAPGEGDYVLLIEPEIILNAELSKACASEIFFQKCIKQQMFHVLHRL